MRLQVFHPPDSCRFLEFLVPTTSNDPKADVRAALVAPVREVLERQRGALGRGARRGRGGAEGLVDGGRGVLVDCPPEAPVKKGMIGGHLHIWLIQHVVSWFSFGFGTLQWSNLCAALPGPAERQTTRQPSSIRPVSLRQGHAQVAQVFKPI